jgi:hypothetical protein
MRRSCSCECDGEQASTASDCLGARRRRRRWSAESRRFVVGALVVAVFRSDAGPKPYTPREKAEPLI